MAIIPRTQRRSSIRPIEYIPAEERMTEPADNEPYTRTPNWVYDAMPHMSNAELRIVMAVARQTIGWHQAWAIISNKDFRDLTGLSKQGVLDGVDAALSKGYIERQGGQKNRSYGYRLPCKVVYSVDNLKDVKPVDMSTQLTTHGQASRQHVVKLVDNFDADLPQQDAPNEAPKEKEIKNKERESATHARARTPREPKQASINAIYEPCQMAKKAIGKPLPPASADRIAAEVRDFDHWQQVVDLWAQRYGTMNVDGMLDWYHHPHKMQRKDAAALHDRRPQAIDAPKVERPPRVTPEQVAAARAKVQGGK